MTDHITNLPHCCRPCPGPSTGSLMNFQARLLCLLILLPGALLHQLQAWLTLVCPAGSNGTFSGRLPLTTGSKITTYLTPLPFTLPLSPALSFSIFLISFMVYLHQLECNLHEDRNFCLFCSPRYPQCLGQCLVHSKCTINICLLNK